MKDTGLKKFSKQFDHNLTLLLSDYANNFALFVDSMCNSHERRDRSIVLIVAFSGISRSVNCLQFLQFGSQPVSVLSVLNLLVCMYVIQVAALLCYVIV